MIQETRVVNLRQEPYDIYIGRGGPWGNPFKISTRCSRAEVIEQYRAYITKRLASEPELWGKLRALRGKRLGCFCKPLPCHGDVLVELLEGNHEVEEARQAASEAEGINRQSAEP